MDTCLKSLKGNVPYNQVVVVDNASQDSTVSIIKESYSNVNLIELDENIGFGRANNIGIKLALEGNAKYCFLLNQDAWVNKDTLQLLHKVAENNLSIDVLSPVQFNPDWKSVEPIFSGYLSDDNTRGYKSDLEKNDLKEYYISEFLNAAAWFIKAKTMKRIGGFNPQFFMYGEDDEWLNRLYYHKGRLALVPASGVAHARNNASEISRPTTSAKEKSLQAIKKLKIQYLVQLYNPNNDFVKTKVAINKDLNRKVLSSLCRCRVHNYLEFRRVARDINSIARGIPDYLGIIKNEGEHFL